MLKYVCSSKKTQPLHTYAEASFMDKNKNVRTCGVFITAAWAQNLATYSAQDLKPLAWGGWMVDILFDQSIRDLSPLHSRETQKVATSKDPVASTHGQNMVVGCSNTQNSMRSSAPYMPALSRKPGATAGVPDDVTSPFCWVDPVVVGQRQRVRPDEVEIVLIRNQAPAEPCHVSAHTMLASSVPHEVASRGTYGKQRVSGKSSHHTMLCCVQYHTLQNRNIS